MIGKIASHSKIIEKLGKGGMGVAYKAQKAEFIIRKQNFNSNPYSKIQDLKVLL